MIKQHKVVAALPAPLEADSVYFVRVGKGFDIYVTNGSGAVSAYKLNTDFDLDGGNSNAVYLPTQNTDGGGA